MFDACVRSDSVTINAPVEVVWDILINIDGYHKWNPFTPKVESSLNIGDDVILHVKMPRRGNIIQVEQVRAVKKPSMLAWGMKMGAKFLLSALREQKIERLSDTQCSYVSTDAFSGLLTPLVMALFGANIRDGFNLMAYALKREAERAWETKRSVEDAIVAN